MKKLIAYFVEQDLFGNLLTLTVIGLGLWSATLIRREVFPNINFDVISVVTYFPGGAAEECERLITSPLEQDLKEVDGIKKLQSVSLEGVSRIVIWLDPDQTTEQKAKNDVQDVVDRFGDLPEGAEDPIVTSIEAKLNPIIEVDVSGDYSPMALRETGRRIESELERIPGVARVVLKAVRDLEIRVEANQKKLSAYQVSLDELVLALKRQNLAIPGGTVEAGENSGHEKVIRTIGDFKKVSDIEQTVIRANDDGQAIKVSHVAKVFYDLEKATVLHHANGRPSLGLTVLKKEGADAIDLVDSVKAKMKSLKPTFQKGTRITYVNDMSYYIKRRLNILLGNFSIGLFFVLLLLPMLIPWRFSMIVAMGEPFAFLGTVLILHLSGQGINLISMIGLIIVSGILVDDSIVVTENAVRLVAEGMDPREAAITGTRQITAPVLASVATTMAAFLPMAFMSGIFGKFIVQIPIAVCTALIVSLLETFFVMPAHIAHWVRREDFTMEKKKAGKLERIMAFTQNYWEHKVVPVYLKWLNFALVQRYKVMLAIFVLFLMTVGVAWKGMKFVLFPPEGIEIFFVRTEVPVGTSLLRHEELLRPIEKIVSQLPNPELEDFTTTIGIVQQDPNDPNTRRGPEFAQIAVFLTPENKRERNSTEIIEELRRKINVPQGFVRVSFDRVNPGPPAGRPINIGVRGQNYDEIMPAVNEIKEILAKIDGATDIADNFQKGKEEIQVRILPVEAAAAGLSVSSVGNTIRAAFEGIVATTVKELDEEVDVRVSLAREQRSDASTLGEVFVPNSRGDLIHLSKISQVRKEQSITIFEHEANQRQVRILGDVNTEKTTALLVSEQVRKSLPDLQKNHPKVEVFFGGEEEDTNESMASLLRAFVFAVVGIFLILILTFKSLLQPLVTLITVPLGIMAVIWTFLLHGLPLSFMAMLGIIALSGVIVNNAIVFVDFVNEQRAKGIGQMESIVDAARMRIRPIFLTTVTTVIGVIPTAYGIGGLDKFVVPIAMALGWGLMFGSVLTAFVFPSALAILDDVARKFSRRP